MHFTVTLLYNCAQWECVKPIHSHKFARSLTLDTVVSPHIFKPYIYLPHKSVMSLIRPLCTAPPSHLRSCNTHSDHFVSIHCHFYIIFILITVLLSCPVSDLLLINIVIFIFQALFVYLSFSIHSPFGPNLVNNLFLMLL